MNARFVVAVDGKVTVTGPAPVRRTAPATAPTTTPLTFAVGDWVAQKTGVTPLALPGKVVQVVNLDGFPDSTLHVRECGNGAPYVVQAGDVVKIRPPKGTP